LLKIVNYAIIKETENAKRNNGGGPSGLGRWPPISTWIIGADATTWIWSLMECWRVV